MQHLSCMKGSKRNVKPICITCIRIRFFFSCVHSPMDFVTKYKVDWQLNTFQNNVSHPDYEI